MDRVDISVESRAIFTTNTYKPGVLLTQHEALTNAMTHWLYLDAIGYDFDYDEQYWYGLADNWDMNIWTEDECHRRVSIYPVNPETHESDYSHWLTFCPYTGEITSDTLEE